MPRLLLASSSPYRRLLLERLRLPFDTAAPDIDETPLVGEQAPELGARLALAKAQALSENHPDHLIIGSDQAASLDGKLLGKPGSIPRAAAQLKAASGRAVTFYTGLSLLQPSTGRCETNIELFTVHFRTLTAQQISRYLERELPLDCTGSFKMEGLGIALFERLEGDDPNTLVGLPLIRLTTMLAAFGVRVL